MNAEYPARYRDSFGEVPTTIWNNGGVLTMIARGVQFQGSDFDRFQPKDVLDPSHLASFQFQHGWLCYCVIEGDIPLPIVTSSAVVDGVLNFVLKLSEPLATNQMNRTRLTLSLTLNKQTYTSDGTTGWFEGEMLNLQCKLPPSLFMKACINCAFSDYSPYGHGLFGNMICFRANKAGYLELPQGLDFDKDDYFDVINTVSEMVQETHLCPEFERRVAGTGYRG